MVKAPEAVVVVASATFAPPLAAMPDDDASLVALVQLPSLLMLALATCEMLIVWPWLAPIWKAWLVKVPSSRLVPLKLVCSATRWISCFSSCTSAFRA
ncbi:hypothetical protein D3C71_1481590 [compost metagenome]